MLGIRWESCGYMFSGASYKVGNFDMLTGFFLLHRHLFIIRNSVCVCVRVYVYNFGNDCWKHAKFKGMNSSKSSN